MEQGVVIKYPKNVQEPQNDGYHDNGIQNRFYGTCHRDEAVDNPQKNTNQDQYHYHVN